MGTPRVAILSAFVTPLRSGAEACAEEVAARLQHGYDITIVAARMSRTFPVRGNLESGVSVIRVGLGLGIDKWLYPFLAPLAVRKLQPDIVHAVLETFAGMALVTCKLLGVRAKRLLTCQSTNTSLLLGPIHRSAHAITAISTPLIERAKKFGRADATLIPNGIDLALLRAATQRAPKSPSRVLFVGRLEPMKGVDTLLKTFERLKDDERWTAHIVGDGSLRDALRRQARTAGLTDRMRFLGRLTGPLLANEYAEAQIFCALSRSEALGNVFLEAQAAGCAVIGTTVGGIPDIVKHGETGLLVPPDDPAATADALRTLLKDNTLRRMLGEAAMAHAANYDWDVIAKRYDEVYQSLRQRAPSH